MELALIDHDARLPRFQFLSRNDFYGFKEIPIARCIDSKKEQKPILRFYLLLRVFFCFLITIFANHLRKARCERRSLL